MLEEKTSVVYEGDLSLFRSIHNEVRGGSVCLK